MSKQGSSAPLKGAINMFLLILLLVILALGGGIGVRWWQSRTAGEPPAGEVPEAKEVSEESAVSTPVSVSVGKKYDWISGLLNVNGKLAYVAQDNNKMFVVFDGKEGKKYAAENIIMININGKLAYKVVLEEEKGQFVVFDGKEGKKYGAVSLLTDINGKLAYAANENGEGFCIASYGKQLIVFDGTEGKRYDFVCHPTNINGKLAYLASSEEQEFVVFDGKEGKKYEEAGKPINVGGKLAYRAYEHGERFVVFNGVEGKRYYKYAVSELVDIDGKLAYKARTAGNIEEFVVFNGVEGKRYENIYNLINIGGKLAYAVREQLADRTYQQFVVFDGVEGKKYKTGYYPASLILMDIGGKLAYGVRTEKGHVVVFDGVEGQSYLKIMEGAGENWEFIEANNIGGKLAYVVEEKTKGKELAKDLMTGEEVAVKDIIGADVVFVVFDGVEGKKYVTHTSGGKRTFISELTDIDGKLAYQVFIIYSKAVVVFNGIEGEVYESVWGLTNVNGKLFYAASDGNKAFIVQWK